MRDVISVECLGSYQLLVRFDDGVEGVVDVHQTVPFNGVFEPLREPDFFAQVKMDAELGTLCWPNGADLDSEMLYMMVSGKHIPG